MRGALQQNEVLVGKNEYLVTVLIHGERFVLVGEVDVMSSEVSAENRLLTTACSFEYVIAFDHANYLVHPDDIHSFSRFAEQSRDSTSIPFLFRIFNEKEEIKQLAGHGHLRHESSSSGYIAFESLPVGLLRLSAVRDNQNHIFDFNISAANAMAEQQLGFALIEKKFSDLQSYALTDLSIGRLREVVQSGEPQTETIFYISNQRPVWFTFTMGKSEDGVFIVIQDERRNQYHDDQIKHQAMLITKVIEASPDIIEILNLQSGRSAYINKMLLEELNYPFEEIKKIEAERRMKELIHPDDIESYNDLLNKLLLAKNTDTFEVQVRWQTYKKGWRWFKTRARIFERDRNGIPVKVLAFSQDITQQKQAEEEKRKHHLLKEVEKARAAFFSNVSHEFRTPLTLLLAPLQELIAKGDFPKAEMDKLQMTYRSALKLQKLVNVLLDFSSVESGKIETVFRPVDISALTIDLASNFRPLIEHAGMKLIVKCPRVEEPIYVNPEMYEKIVFNLLSNAFKFTLRGKIEVTIKDNKNHVKVIVRDTGVGIEPGNLEKIFDRFVRLTPATARTYEGSGIGLALVRELVSVHRGSIKVDSEPGKGSTFIVTLSKGKEHLPQKSIFESANTRNTATTAAPYIEELKGWMTGFNDLQDNNRKRAKKLPGTKPCVLVIDDNSDMLAYLKSLLEHDYQVIAARNGKAAMELISDDFMPDLVLSDIMMPEVDGLTFLQRIKNDPKTKDIPIILLSARAGDESKVEGLHAGADDYLVKPFSAKEMLARIEARIEIAATHKQLKKALLDQNKVLEEKINEKTQDLQQANLLLREKNSQLEIVNSDLGTFAFVASHDLREPLRKIQLYSQLLFEHEVTGLTDRAREISKKILSSAERMNLLIEDILAYSQHKSESDHYEKVDLNSMVRHVKENLAGIIAEKNATIVHEVLPSMKGNPLQLSQLLENLISNSLKFHRPDENPEVRITSAVLEGESIDHPLATKGKRYLRLEIKDNGIGFEQKYAGKIFQMFQRLHGRTQYSGTGMGLAICKKIVERHGGFIGAKSEPDKGSTFCCYFPYEMVDE